MSVTATPPDPGGGAATAAEIVPYAAAHMRVFFLAVPFLFGFFVFTALMRGYGDTCGPLRVMALSVALDSVLIFGWGPVPAFGIEGAAWATLIARAAATLVGWYLLFGTSAGPDVRLGDLVPDPSVVGDAVRLGVPTALEQSGTAFAFVVLTAMVSTFPPAVVVAYGLGNQLVSLIFLPATGLAQAVNTVVGQNLGARRADRRLSGGTGRPIASAVGSRPSGVGVSGRVGSGRVGSRWVTPTRRSATAR